MFGQFVTALAPKALPIYLGSIATMCLRHFARLFLPKHGRNHRLSGLAYFTWLSLGAGEVWRRAALGVTPSNLFYFVYDVVLGFLGILLTLTAAHEFPHKHVQNRASGTLVPTLTTPCLTPPHHATSHHTSHALSFQPSHALSHTSQPTLKQTPHIHTRKTLRR